ncbi:MAG: SMP-30/gluconolactonase/LRE family protein [Terrimonas sp.]|nr:SMP-30/gluconolactonase/LRE family protein [Terrimonas sp.]
MKYISFLLLWVLCFSCIGKNDRSPYPTTGFIERFDPALDAIISPDATVEIIATGLDWSEGPLWIDNRKMLLFSDVPRDTVFKWTEAKGMEFYLTPSGYTDTIKRGGEIGSNGLLLDRDGNLVLCQCGNRQMAVMNASLDHPKPDYRSLADRYDGKRFSSPNDAVYNRKAELFFTDPPYGLVSKDDSDPEKEIPFNGVFKLATDGSIKLLIDSLSRPNGLAFFPGEKELLVANSDPAIPNWYLFDIRGDSLANPRIFYSAAGYDPSWKGLPDGLKIDRQGNVFASGPGGVYIFNTFGKKLGLIRLEEAASNCALSGDEKTLFITNDMNILRIKMRD